CATRGGGAGGGLGGGGGDAPRLRPPLAETAPLGARHRRGGPPPAGPPPRPRRHPSRLHVRHSCTIETRAATAGSEGQDDGRVVSRGAFSSWATWSGGR